MNVRRTTRRAFADVTARFPLPASDGWVRARSTEVVGTAVAMLVLGYLLSPRKWRNPTQSVPVPDGWAGPAGGAPRRSAQHPAPGLPPAAAERNLIDANIRTLADVLPCVSARAPPRAAHR